MKTLLLFLTIVIAMTLSVFAQKIGSFDELIEFQDVNRTISYYVPTDYNPDFKYDLVVGLHELRDNSRAYRDTIISQLKWNTILPNTIFIFPDGGYDKPRSFYEPEGDELIIIEAINSAKAKYNISEDDIILQGFSNGGRSALKFGLEHPDLFKGIILNTPAVQGILDLENHPEYSYGYQFANASKIPIAIVYGELNWRFSYFEHYLNQILVENNCRVNLVEIPDEYDYNQEATLMQSSFDFINSPIRDGVDIDLVKLDLSYRTCDDNIQPSLLVRNSGSDKTGSFLLDIDVDGVNYQHLVEVNLGSFESKWIDLDIPEIVLHPGMNNYTVSLNSISSGVTDIDDSNNSISGPIIKYVDSKTEPIFFGFEPEDETYDWAIGTSGDTYVWSINIDSKTGLYSFFKLTSIYTFASFGLSEDLFSPFFDLTQLDNKTVTFDYAFNYHKFIPPFSSEELIFTDTLKVFITKDCGETYDLLYEKSGAELATAPEPIINPKNFDDAYYTPTSDEWRSETIDLSDYAFETNSTLKFSIVSGQGGTFYIDNINIGGAVTSVEAITGHTFTISPNPAKSTIKIDDNNTVSGTKYTLTSINGTVIESYNATSISDVDISKLNSGVYFITKTNGTTSETQKFIKE